MTDICLACRKVPPANGGLFCDPCRQFIREDWEQHHSPSYLYTYSYQHLANTGDTAMAGYEPPKLQPGTPPSPELDIKLGLLANDIGYRELVDIARRDEAMRRLEANLKNLR